MKILQIGSYLAPHLVGGAEVSAMNVAAGLRQRGHEVISVRRKNEGAGLTVEVAREDEAGWLVKTFRPYEPIEVGKPFQKLEFYAREFLSVVDKKSLHRALSSSLPDVALIHSFRGIGYNFLGALSDAGLPLAFVLHDYALICMNKSIRRKGKNCTRICAQCQLTAAINRRSILNSSACALIGPSKFVLDAVGNALNVRTARRFHIPNPNRYNAIPRLRSDHDGHVKFGYIGRLEPDKGLYELLSATGALADQFRISLTIAGAGTLQGYVEEFSRDKSWINYLGFVDSAEVCRIMDSIDYLVLPALWAENFPGIAVQAGMAGTPVIAFNVGGVGEIVINDSNGILVNGETEIELKSALLKAIREPSLLARLSKGALELSQRFDPDYLIDKYIEALEWLSSSS